MSTFALMATVTASTKRPPAIASGKRGVPATNIASLKCFPLDPISPELRQTLALNTPHELLQSYVEGGLDIVEGDILVVGTNSYRIRAVGQWYWPMDAADTSYLVLEELKT